MSKPLWKLKQFISQKRNLEFLIWPENVNEEGQRFPPQPSITENRKNQEGEWEKKTIYLTRPSLPVTSINLQLMYQALLMIDQQIESNRIPPPSEPQSDLSGRIYKFIREKQSVDVNTLLTEFKLTADALQAALKTLISEKMIIQKTKDLTVFVEVA